MTGYFLGEEVRTVGACDDGWVWCLWTDRKGREKDGWIWAQQVESTPWGGSCCTGAVPVQSGAADRPLVPFRDLLHCT